MLKWLYWTMLKKSIYFENLLDIDFWLSKKYGLCINKAFVYACKIGKIQSVKYILKFNPDVNYNQRAFYTSIKNNCYFSMCNLENRVPLISAIDNNHIDIVKFLINNGAKIYGFELTVAISGCKTEIVKYLVEECKVDIDFYKGYALRTICSHVVFFATQTNVDILNYLVSKEADILIAFESSNRLHVKQLLSYIYVTKNFQRLKGLF